MYELRVGSCLDPVMGLPSLADGSVDVIITDPPYEAEAHTAQRRQKPAGWRANPYGDGRAVIAAPIAFPPITEAERDEVAMHMGRVVRHRVLVFCQVEAVHLWRASFARGGLIYRRTIPWIKPDAMPSLHGRWPGQSFESIVLATKRGAVRCPIGGKARYYEVPRGQGSGHQTTKPLALMRAMVEDFASPGDLVADPYAGSGSTGVACRALGRRFIGWEINPGYAEIAKQRLDGATPTKAGQLALL